jgi:ATP/maltotriose-dependent transcriptional regulator MalT
VYTHLALARFMSGDTVGADAAMEQSVATAALLDFPQGPWSHAYGAWLQSWMLADRGEFDRAADLAADAVHSGTRHGFDSWVMINSTQHAAVETLRALAAPEPDVATLATRGAELGGLAELWRTMELLVLLPYSFTVAGAALTVAGDLDGARHYLEQARALADRTSMRFYEAETMRRAAYLETDPTLRRRALRSALHRAREQSARPFELRIALDLHILEGATADSLVETALYGIDQHASSFDIDAARAIASEV